MAGPLGRVYFAERLLSAAGYFCLPILFDALSYYLPPFKRVSSRIVKVGTRSWELWSPNSTVVAYYPGLRDDSFALGLDEPDHLRRCDGHRGCFDPTVSPQVLDPERLWYPFVRRVADLGSYPEFTPFLDIWDEATASVKSSFIERLQYRITTISQGAGAWHNLASSHPNLWQARPQRPQVEDVHHLSSIRQFAAALDFYTRIQRGAKLTSAWCRMAHALSHDTSNTSLNGTVAAADDLFMGTWINGSSEEVGKWLLKLGVPCFVIHELDSEMDWHNAEYAHPRISFVAGTPAADLVASKNPIDAAVVANGGRLTNLTEDRWTAVSSPPSLWKDRVRSSSYGQGWRNEKYVPPCAVDVASPFEEANGYILPPAVAAVGSGAGKWSNWKEDETDDGDFCITKIGKEVAKHNGDRVYYDHENRRAIAFESALRPPRDYLADPSIFGYPAPEVLYREEVSGGRYRACKASVWLYRQRDVAKEDVGKVFHLPAASLIPNKDDRMDVACVRAGNVVASLTHRRHHSPSPVCSPPRRPHSPPRRRNSPRAAMSPSRDFRGRRRGSSARGYEGSTSDQVYRHRDSRSRSPRRPPHGRGRSPVRRYDLGRYERQSPSPLALRHVRPRSPYVNPRRSFSRTASTGRFGSSRSSSRSRTLSLSHSRSRSRSQSPTPRSLTLSLSRNHSPARSVSPSRDISMEVEDNESTAVCSSGVITSDFTRLKVLFPEPPPPPFPVLDVISPDGQSNILAISNLPVYFLWIDVLVWFRSLLPLVKRPQVRRVLRSIENGYQVFWIVLASISEAATLRGLLSARRTVESPTLRVDFVHGDVYSERASKFRDGWSPQYGMEIENKPQTRGSLLDRLGFADPADRPSSMPPVDDPFPGRHFLDYQETTGQIAGSSQLVQRAPPRATSQQVPPLAFVEPLPLAQRLGPIVLPKARRQRKRKRRPGLDPADAEAL